MELLWVFGGGAARRGERRVLYEGWGRIGGQLRKEYISIISEKILKESNPCH